MTNQIKAELCTVCNGNGVQSNGHVCENCRGIGLIGTDGANEYYLGDDGRGGLQITDVKKQAPAQPQQEEKKQERRSGVLKSLLFVIVVIAYSGFIGAYLTLQWETRFFWLGTLISIGFVFLLMLYDARIVGFLVRTITRIVASEPEDFLSELEKRKKSSSQNPNFQNY